MTLGTFIESLDRGADQLVIGGCQAFCRFGYYWPVQKQILNDLGYDPEIIPINYDQPLEILQTLKKLSANLSYTQTVRATRITWLKNRLTDEVDRLLYRYRALEVTKRSAEHYATKIFRMIVELQGVRKIKAMKKELPKMFAREVEIHHDRNPIKIAINGEIYVVLEPSLNVNVHKRLNEMGVITESPTTMRRFYDLGHKWNPFVTMDYTKADRVAKPYIEHRCGGEAREAVGETILYKRDGWDGIIHLYPFTCLPHISSKNILPQVSKHYDMPVLSLVVDEQTGEAGFQTRLEAYVDLLKRKRDMDAAKGTSKLAGTKNHPQSPIRSTNPSHSKEVYQHGN
ncbi:MAG: hypothetical protein ACTSVZ_02680 [Promethearchaeota archaeon]